MAVYDVAVRMTLEGGLAGALAVITSHMIGMRSHTAAIQQGFESWRPALLGVVGIFAGGAIVKGLMDIAASADKVYDRFAQMRMQGQSWTDIQKNYSEAFRVSGVTARPVDAVLQQMKEMSYYTSDPETAREMTERMSKLETVYHAASGKSAEGQIIPIMKVLEEAGIMRKGLVDPTKRKHLDIIIEGLTKDIEATGGLVTPAQIQQSFLYARAARYGWVTPRALESENPFLTTVLPYMIQTYGTAHSAQSGPGAALMSEFTKNVQGILSKGSAREARELDIFEGKTGGKFGIRGHFKRPDLFEENPYEWTQQVLWPQLEKKLKSQGIDPQSSAGAEAIIEHVSKLYGTRMAADPAIFMSMFGKGRLGEQSPIDQHISLQKKALSLDMGFQEAWGMPMIVMERLANEWKRFWVSIGVALNPGRTSILGGIADWFKGLGDSVERLSKSDPTIIQDYASALLAVSAGLAAAGGLAVASAVANMIGLPGLLIGLGVAAAAMSPKVQEAVREFGRAFQSLDSEKIKAAGTKLGKAVVEAIVQGIASIDWGSWNKKADDAVAQFHNWLAAFVAGIINTPAATYASPHPWHDKNRWLNHWQTKDTIEPYGQTPYVNPFGDYSIRIGPSTSHFHDTHSWPNFLHPGGGLGGSLMNQSWEPGGGGGGTVVNNVIQLDGAAIARAVHDYHAADLVHPRQAPFHDGRSNYTPPDHQPMT